jgi:uncharacterized protein RhaS with RHS repeats
VETGLHYSYFRYYNPQTGRYITPDPIGLEGGINLFSYVAGNPVNWIDPLGLRYAERYAIYGVMIGSTIAAVLSVPADVATVGGNIFLTPVEIAAGGALGGAIFYAIGNLIDQSISNSAEESLDSSMYFSRTRDQGRNWATEEAKRKAQETGQTPCDVLAQMLKDAKCSGEAKKVRDIEQAQKFLGCRRSGIQRRDK